jgi:hypothetical protein
MGAVGHIEVRARRMLGACRRVFFAIEISGRRSVFNAIVLHSSPVAVVPQPVLSHAGLSQAPEKVSPPPVSIASFSRLRALLTSITDNHRLESNDPLTDL